MQKSLKTKLNQRGEDLDLAFVVGLPHNSDVVAIKILSSELIWVTAPCYQGVHDWDDTVEDLSPHLLYCERRYQVAEFAVRDKNGCQMVNQADLMSVNDPLILKQIIKDGGSVGLLPKIICQKELQSGALVQIYTGIKNDESAEIYALMPSLRLQPQKARLFIEFVEEIVTQIETKPAFIEKTDLSSLKAQNQNLNNARK